MKCERALALLSTSSSLGRWRARRHVARCPHCTREKAALERIETLLAAAPPLSLAQRALWTSAATEYRPVRPRRVRKATMAAAALVLAIGMAGLIARLWRPRPTIERPAPQVVRVPTTGTRAAPDMIRELDGVSASLRALSRELAELSRRAELLDERRDAENLARRFDRYVAMK
jgi:hypothetical protein